MGVSDADVGIKEGTVNSGAYDDLSGGRATRIMTPCDNGSCEYRRAPTLLNRLVADIKTAR